MVYFIQSGKDGPIKIGRSDDPSLRLKQLQTAHPYRLNLLAAIAEDGVDTEGALHGQFAEFRMSGEWFHPCRRLLSFIDDLAQFDLIEEARREVQAYGDHAEWRYDDEKQIAVDMGGKDPVQAHGARKP